jgi:hypothetical protein
MVSGLKGTAAGVASGGPTARTHSREFGEGLPKATGGVICRHYSRLTAGHDRFVEGRFIEKSFSKADRESVGWLTNRDNPY